MSSPCPILFRFLNPSNIPMSFLHWHLVTFSCLWDNPWTLLLTSWMGLKRPVPSEPNYNLKHFCSLSQYPQPWPFQLMSSCSKISHQGLVEQLTGRGYHQASHEDVLVWMESLTDQEYLSRIHNAKVLEGQEDHWVWVMCPPKQFPRERFFSDSHYQVRGSGPGSHHWAWHLSCFGTLGECQVRFWTCGDKL